MTEIVVNQAVLSDLEDVAGLFDEYRQFYGQSSNVEAVREFLLARENHGESVVFLAKDDLEPVGFTQLFPAFSSVSLVRTFILNDLYVRPQARRQGVAKLLLQAAEEYARSVGAARLTLSTATTNEQAQELYRVAGWKQDDQFYVFHRAIKA